MTSRGKGEGFDRRRFLTLCGAAALAPGLARAASDLPSDTDVVIVGAGAAGISAAHALAGEGVRHVLIEAGSRVGGRAFTESDTFGVPFDHGAHWVQNQERNPYFNRAKASGHRFYKATEAYRIFRDGAEVSEAEAGRLWEVWDEVYGAITEAGKAGEDVSAASVSPSGDEWAQTAWFGIGPWEMGKDLKNFSCVDWWNSADSVDWYCAEGYGTLVAEHAAGLTVALETPATRIRWGGQGVEVETPRGTIRAKAVIVTVSTGVLAAEGIVFEPALPVETQEAIHAIPMGDYNHIAVQFSEDIFGMGEDGYLLHHVGEDSEAFGALTNASGTGLAYCDVGGSFARELEAAGEEAAVDFVMGKLRGMLGGDVDRHFVKAAATTWTADPLFRGCYASAAPGGYPMREVLRRPVGERVFLAGEACHGDLWATVGGADLSGRDTARAVALVVAG